MPHIVEVPLRWGDMDAQGHINNGAYVDYLQQARVDWLTRSPHADLLGSGIVVVSHQVEFQAPVVFSERPLTVSLWVESVGAARLILGYRICDDDRLVARARTTLAALNLATGSPRRLPAAARAWMRDSAAPAAHWRQLPRTPNPRLTLPAPARVPTWVRWGDLDAYGHVNNVRFFDYAQHARVAAMGKVPPSEPESAEAAAVGTPPSEAPPTAVQGVQAAPRSEPEPADSAPSAAPNPYGGWVVVRQDMDYLAQLRMRLEPCIGSLQLLDIGRSSITLGWELYDDDQYYARARTVLVHLDSTGKPSPVPSNIGFRTVARETQR